jgi:uncharacterized membrane protein (UPF0182 family)
MEKHPPTRPPAEKAFRLSRAPEIAYWREAGRTILSSPSRDVPSACRPGMAPFILMMIVGFICAGVGIIGMMIWLAQLGVIVVFACAIIMRLRLRQLEPFVIVTADRNGVSQCIELRDGRQETKSWNASEIRNFELVITGETRYVRLDLVSGKTECLALIGSWEDLRESARLLFDAVQPKIDMGFDILDRPMWRQPVASVDESTRPGIV